MSEIAKPERLFIGVPIAAGTRERLISRLPANIPGRIAPPENWHFTLRFLGSTLSDQKERLIGKLCEVNFGRSFEIELDVLGAFPNPRRARVVWLGVGKGSDKLSAIAKAVEAAAVSAGFEAERREFSPHLTLSRLREPHSLTQLLTHQKSLGEKMRVSEVVLYESRTGRPHSHYSVVMGFPLSPSSL